MSRVAGRHGPVRRDAITAAALAAILAALVASAMLDPPSGPSRSPAEGAPPVPPAPGVSRPRVEYTGPRGELAGPVVMRARVRAEGARVVAVTFRLDGRPLGTDTTAPYTLDVDASLLPPGRHRVQVEAVDRVGGRAVSAPARVRTGGQPHGITVSAPGPQLDRALAALARGHVTVLLGPGRYPVGAVRLGDGARLVGAGPGTVLTASRDAWSLVEVRGRRVRVSGLAIEGGTRIGRAIAVAPGSADVRLQRLRISGVRDTGVEAWGAHAEVSVQDSVIVGDDASGAGVYDVGSSDSRDSSVVRTEIHGFRAFGIDFAQRYYGRRAAARRAVALDNRIARIVDPEVANGTREGGIWSGGVAAAIIGNRIRDTGWDGIETVGSSYGVSIVGNDIARTRVGIYLEHETNGSLISRNAIADVVAGINVEWRYEGRGSSANTFTANRITGARQTGLFVDVAGDRNRITGNVVEGGRGPAIVLQGASENLVTDNRACARSGPVVQLQSASYDNGVAAHSLRNRVVGNRKAPSCGPP